MNEWTYINKLATDNRLLDPYMDIKLSPASMSVGEFCRPPTLPYVLWQTLACIQALVMLNAGCRWQWLFEQCDIWHWKHAIKLTCPVGLKVCQPAQLQSTDCIRSYRCSLLITPMINRCIYISKFWDSFPEFMFPGSGVKKQPENFRSC